MLELNARLGDVPVNFLVFLDRWRNLVRQFTTAEHVIRQDADSVFIHLGSVALVSAECLGRAEVEPVGEVAEYPLVMMLKDQGAGEVRELHLDFLMILVDVDGLQSDVPVNNISLVKIVYDC